MNSRYILAILLLIILVPQLKGQNSEKSFVTQIDSESIKGRYELRNTFLKFFEDRNEQFDFEAVSSPRFASRFAPYIQLPKPEGDQTHPFRSHLTYWVKIDLQSNLKKESNWILFLGYISEAEVYVQPDMGHELPLRAGFLVPHAQHNPKEGQEVKTMITLAPQSRVSVYVKFKNTINYPPEPSFFLESQESWQEVRDQTNMVQGIFHGLLWMILVYNFFLFLSLRKYTYLHFLCYVLFISFYFLNEYGYLEDYFLANEPRISFYLGNLVYFALIFYILFNRSFLQIPTYYPRLDRFVKIWLGISILFALISIPLHHYAFDIYQPVRNIFHLVYVLALVVFIFAVLFIRDVLASYFVLGNFFVLAGGFFIVLGNYGIIPFNLYYLLGGLVAQLITFTMVMSYRYRQTLMEQQEAQEKLILQLRANEHLQTKVNRELEQKVQERTVDIVNAKEEIQTQNELLLQRGKELEKSYKNTKDSIRYAQRLQGAILGDEGKIISDFRDGFILFRPRDIVSGDFYWTTTIERQRILIVADCTGHGVPGALMTVLGNAVLEDVVNHEKITEPDQILYALDKRVVETLQSQSGSKQKDGMDLVVINFDEISYTLKYAGAKNPLYYIRDYEIEQIKGSKFPIGIYEHKKEKTFPLHELQARPGDIFYLSTDGYQDQFGGEKGFKYMKKRFREFLMNNSHLPMSEQKRRLENELDLWQGGNHQTDDILVVGIKV